LIRFGPAGIPLSCKGRTLRDGIADVHHLGLTAMEVQFIKVNPLTRTVFDEEVGKVPNELLQQLVVNVGNSDPITSPPLGPSFTTPLKRKDALTTLTWSLAKDHGDLDQTKQLARALDVDLTLHAPYYVDFFGSADAREQSTRQIQWSGVLAHGLGARLAVTHLGFYGGGPRADSVQELTEIVTDLSAWLRTLSKGQVRLGIEPSGHPDVFGSREEVLELVRKVKGTVPVFNVPHLAARERTIFDNAETIAPVIKEFVGATDGPLYAHFSGVELYGPGEFRLTPIKRGQVRFDPLAELLSERDYDVSVISSSPLLEHDAMYMKLLYERALTKRWTKLHAPPPVKAPAPKPKAVPLIAPARSSHGKAPPPRKPMPIPAARHAAPRPSKNRSRPKPPEVRKHARPSHR
jgi:deoxyribonuclease IV